MKPPTLRDLVEIVDLVVEVHYPSSSPAGASGQAPLPIPELEEPVVRPLSRTILNELKFSDTGVHAHAKTLASIASVASRTFHASLCPKVASRSRSRRACRTELLSITDLITILAKKYYNLELDRQVGQAASDILEATDLTDQQVMLALEARLTPLLHPPWNKRRLLPLNPSRPIVQINSPITGVTDREYLQVRSTALKIKTAIEPPHVCEVTSDYVSPNNKSEGIVDEGLVRASIYRTSAMVIFVEGGQLGTAIALSLAEELLVPVLVLAKDRRHLEAARFPGLLGGRETAAYDSPDSAVEVVRDFLSHHDAAIRDRSHRLAKYAQVSMKHLLDRLARTDISAFDSSTITLERARFLVSDPVIWFQSPRYAVEEVTRILGISAGHDVPSNSAHINQLSASSRSDPTGSRQPLLKPNSGFIDRSHIRLESLRTLFSAAEVLGLDWQEVSRLVGAYESDLETFRPVSAVQRIYSHEDWIELYHRRKGSA